MLLELAQWLEQYARAFNVFSYLTLRAVLACLTALIISFVVGPGLIRRLTVYKIGQSVRDDGPQTHLAKAGTPTMGGALILVSIVITTLLWADLSNRYVWVVLVVTLLFGAVGWVDDYRKVIEKNSRGLPSRWKYFWQSVFGLGAAVFLFMTAQSPVETATGTKAFRSPPPLVGRMPASRPRRREATSPRSPRTGKTGSYLPSRFTIP